MIFAIGEIGILTRYFQMRSLLSNRAGLPRNAADGLFTKPSLFSLPFGVSSLSEETGTGIFPVLFFSGYLRNRPAKG
jgi:hypothetical protein